MWAKDEDVFCYFNNDTNGCALRDARWLARACVDAGYPTSRVPPASETKVG
jgi:hypothetical protein